MTFFDMNQRAHYLIQILDKIGAPLLGAADYGASDADTATLVASLLGKVVETSISMNKALDLTATDAQDDSLRVALAALAGSLVADQYKQKGKVPEAADINRIQSAMSAVLTFGDNFTLSDAHIARLEKLKADGGVVDAHQINIQYVDALIPVINAVGAFPFGQPEQKLIMDVSDRLVKRTAEMREVLLPGLSGDDEKLAELAILRATASVYAACHEAETQKLTGADGDAPATLSIDPVWKAFEMRTAMLEAVAKNLIPEGTVSAAVAAPVAADPVAPVAAPPPVETPPVQAPVAPVTPPPPPQDSGDTAAKPAIFQSKPAAAVPETPPAEAPPPVAPVAPPVTPPPVAPVTPPPAAAPPPVQEPPAAPPAQTEQASSGAGPMAFFKKPGEGTPPATDNSVAPPMAQPEAPVAPVTPPVAPPPAAPPTPPPAAAPVEPPPPATPPAQETTGDDSGDSGDSGGNPMSFFGKKD